MTRGDRNFLRVLTGVAVAYVGLLLAMVLTNAFVAANDWSAVGRTVRRHEIRQAILLSLGTSLLSAVLSVWIGTGIAYLVSREAFFGRRLVDFLMDLPIFLPPLVIGISLLILFRQTPLAVLDSLLGIAFCARDRVGSNGRGSCVRLPHDESYL